MEESRMDEVENVIRKQQAYKAKLEERVLNTY